MTPVSDEVTSYGPAYQRLWGAMDSLIGYEGSHSDRLAKAWRDIQELHLLAGNANDSAFQIPRWLDEEIQPVLALWEQYSRPTHLEAAAAGLTSDERRQHARDILEWYSRFREQKHAYQRG